MGMRAIDSNSKRRYTRMAGKARLLLTVPNVSLAFLLLCCLLIAPLEQYETFISIAMLGVILINWKNDEFYVISCILLLFWEQFYLIAGSTPLYRVYSYLLLIRFFLDIGKVRFRPQFLPALVVFACFCIISVGRMTMRTGLNLLADTVLSYITLTVVRSKPSLMRKLTLVFALAAVCAGFYSIMAGTVVSYETGVMAEIEITRYYGTVGDANYASCFYNAAIFMALCSDAMKRWYLRLPIVGTLVYFLFMTASQTGLICFTLGIMVYLVLRYGAIGGLLSVLFGLGTSIGVYLLLTVPSLHEVEPFSTLYNRLMESMMNLEGGDIAELTTNRTVLWGIAMDYFRQLPLLKKLIGGSVVATIISEEYFLKTVGAIHQSYIQGLLDFGIIGVVIVFGTRILQTLADVVTSFTEKNAPLPVDLMRCVVLCGFVFLLYAFTLDMFMDWRFLYLYFM